MFDANNVEDIRIINNENRLYTHLNPYMPNAIKIGITENLEKRIKQLDNTSVAVPFECYYAVKVSDASPIEKHYASRFLMSAGLRDNREFFNTDPRSSEIFSKDCRNHGWQGCQGCQGCQLDDIVETPQDLQALNKARNIRKNFRLWYLRHRR